MAAIDMVNIVKQYGDGFPAVNDVSIDVQDGEFMILVGPSGCGKSTLLRMIVGLEDITSGDMVIGGKKMNDLAPRDRNLAMVFQNYALYPHMTVYENIAFPLRLAGKLSNDEIDAKLRGQMRTEIARLQRRLGITTVYVTHDQTEAMTLGDRVAVLRRGVLQQLATPRELYSRPVNLFVAGFIGSPPMNFLPAVVNGDQVELPFGTITVPAEKARVAEGRGLLIAGIRPEHFEDAEVVDPAAKGRGSTFTARVDVVEWLGHEAYAYIPFDAPPEVADQLTQLERDLDGEAMRTQLVVSLDSNSKIEKGEDAEIWVDSSEIHLFDPATGENLTAGATVA